jgi:hypothetical protein
MSVVELYIKVNAKLRLSILEGQWKRGAYRSN